MEQLLREAIDCHLCIGLADDAHLHSQWHAARTKAILAAHNKAWRSRTRRPAKPTRPRGAWYTMDVQECLAKYDIEMPLNLAQTAYALRCCHHKDLSRALRVVFLQLLLGRGEHRHDPLRAQCLLEDALSMYNLSAMRGVFLLALHKHLAEDPCGPVSSTFRHDAD